MPLAGYQWKQLSDALRQAFTLAALDRLLRFSLDINREDIALGEDYQDVVFKVIQTAEAEGWTAKLLTAARATRPENPMLVATAIELGTSSASVDLERRVRDDAPFLDPDRWRAALGQREFQVCRVEVEAGTESGTGTGFLVGPDLCLTNYHVVAPLIEGRGDPAATVLRFDYKRVNGLVVDVGTECRLAKGDDWLLASSPPSAADERDDGSLPGKDELDYAVLRVADSPGKRPAGLAAEAADAPMRGWITTVSGTGPAPDNPLLILQHPELAPLKLALGFVLSVNANGTRIRHRVNTERGSSGSPCFDVRLDLVALHHAGDPNYEVGRAGTYNQAVPMTAILQHLKANGCPETIPAPAA